MRLEGSGATQLVQMISHLASANNTAPFELATVVSAAPSLTVKLDDVNLTLDRDFLMLTQTASDASLVSGDRVLMAVIEADNLYIILDKVVLA